MATHYWEPAAGAEPLILPAQVADVYLTAATPEQLRVLLWLSRHAMQMDTALCATALGLSPAACDEAVSYWVRQGLLLPTGATASRAQARPAAVKPQVKEVLTYQHKHPEFSHLVETASARLGKAIGHGDTATLMYLVDTVGLPPEVIEMEIAYAVSVGKGNMRAVEKIALDWADRELTTAATVDAHIAVLERNRTAATHVEKVLSLPRALNDAQAEMAYRWTTEWHFGDEMLCRAAGVMTEAIHKFSAAYLDRILERWFAEGIDTPDKIAVNTPKKKGAAATDPERSSIDMDALEEELMRYRPHFIKK